MVTRYYGADFTVPKATAKTAPASLAFPLEDGQLLRVDIDIPPGHAGKTGIRVLWNGTPVIPYKGTDYLTGDNRHISLPYDGPMTETGLTLQAFNTDNFPHLFLVRALMQDPPPPSPVVPVSSIAATGGSIADAAQLVGQLNDAASGPSIDVSGITPPADRTRIKPITPVKPGKVTPPKAPQVIPPKRGVRSVPDDRRSR